MPIIRASGGSRFAFPIRLVSARSRAGWSLAAGSSGATPTQLATSCR